MSRLHLAYAAAWLSCAIGVTTAIIITKSAVPLWAFLLPAMLSVSEKDN